MKIINQILDTIFTYQLQVLNYHLLTLFSFVSFAKPNKNRQGFITVRDPVNPDKALRQE